MYSNPRCVMVIIFLHWFLFHQTDNYRFCLALTLGMGTESACSHLLNVKKAFLTRALLCWMGWDGMRWGGVVRSGACATWDQHIPQILPHCHAAVS